MRGTNIDATATQAPVSVKPKVQFWVLVALLVAGVLLLNAATVLLGRRFPLSADLTAGEVFKLEKETRAFIRDLDADVQIYILANADDFLAEAYLIQAQRIIEQFPRYSPRVSLRYVDYASDPSFTSRFPGVPLELGNILVTSGGRVKKLMLSELFNFSYADASGSIAISSSRAEEAVTSAIIYVTTDSRIKFALLTGNGAAETPALTRVLEDNNYDVQEVNLSTGEIGADVGFAALLAPQSDYTANEMSKLDAFLYNSGAYGKTLLYTADPAQPPLPNIEAFLREWGVEIGDGVVFEADASRTYMNQPYYAIPDYIDTDLRDKLIDANSKILLPMSRPLDILFNVKDDNRTNVLLGFGASAGVRPPGAPDDFRASQAERRGPFPAMVLAEKRLVKDGYTQEKSCVIVSASTQMLETTIFYSTVLTNSEYLTNVFNTLAKRENTVNVRPKSMGGYAFALSGGQSVGVGIAMFAIIPALIIGFGIFVWLKRRYS